MGNLTIATIFIVMINILMWFSQLAMLDINPQATVCYLMEGSILDNVKLDNTGNIDNNIINQLPETSATQTSSGGSGFITDSFNTIIGWLKSVPGLRYLINVVAAPYNILKCWGLPYQVAFGIGALWYIVCTLVVVAWIMWRE
jgi:hypothetical protein